LPSRACPLVPASAETPDYATWDQYLGGPDSSQYSALDQVTPANVAQLQVAWEYPAGEGAAPQFNPIVVDGTMYVQTGGGQIAALDPVTGREKWKSETTGRISTRGINYWQSADGSDRRLVFLNDGLVRAIDARTGKYVPNFSIDLRDALPPGHADTPRPLMTSNPGRIFEDSYIVSLPGGQSYASHPANIQAYDIRTGALKWSFNVVPQRGEPGAETWPDKDHEKFGGGHNWSEFTIDPETGVAYVPTAARGSISTAATARQQPLRQLAARARRAHRQAAVALPGGAPRHVGLRPAQRPEADDHHKDGKTSRWCIVRQARLRVRVRPPHRRASVADRGAAGAAVGRAGRACVADPAVPDLAAAVLAPVVHRSRTSTLTFRPRTRRRSARSCAARATRACSPRRACAARSRCRGTTAAPAGAAPRSTRAPAAVRGQPRDPDARHARARQPARGDGGDAQRQRRTSRPTARRTTS
jgi:hypothetical protein